MRTWTVLIKVLNTVKTDPKTTRYRYRYRNESPTSSTQPCTCTWRYMENKGPLYVIVLWCPTFINHGWLSHGWRTTAYYSYYFRNIFHLQWLFVSVTKLSSCWSVELECMFYYTPHLLIDRGTRNNTAYMYTHITQTYMYMYIESTLWKAIIGTLYVHAAEP